MFDSDGPLTGEFRVNETEALDQLFPSVAMADDGSFVVTWDSFGQDGDDRGIIARRFNADGIPLSGDIIVNQERGGRQFLPDIAMDSSGRFIVTWVSDASGTDTQVIFRAFDEAGSSLGNDTILSMVQDASQTFPRVTRGTNDEFFAVWNESTATTNHVVARRIEANGSLLDSPIIVTPTSMASSTRPDISVGELGSPVVVWHQASADGSSNGVLGRRFFPDGEARELPFLINSTTLGNQSFPRVASGMLEDFVVTWESANVDPSGLAVAAQRFLVNRKPALDLNGPETGVDIEVDFDDSLPLQPLTSDLATITDPDGDTLIWMKVQMTNRRDGASETLQVDLSGTNLVSSFSDGVLTITSAGGAGTPEPISDFQQALRQTTYRNVAADPINDDRIILMTVNDGIDTSDPVTSLVSYNQPPIVDLNGTANGLNSNATYTERDPATRITTNEAVLIDDHAEISEVTFVLTNPQDADHETLDVTLAGTCFEKQYTRGATSHVLTVSASNDPFCDVALADALLKTLVYSNTAFNPGTEPRRIEVTAFDGDLFSETAVLSVDVETGAADYPRAGLCGHEQ